MVESRVVHADIVAPQPFANRRQQVIFEANPVGVAESQFAGRVSVAVGQAYRAITGGVWGEQAAQARDRGVAHAAPTPDEVAQLRPGASRLQRLVHRGWDVGIALLRPLLAAGLLGHVRALLVRLPHLLILLAWHYLALRMFGVEVPTLTAALYLPVVFAVASLPISPQGLGTAQVAALFFFREYSQGGDEAVLAYSLSMTAISTVGSLAMGLLFLRRGAALGLNVSEEVEAQGAPGAPSGPDAASPASIEPLPASRADAARPSVRLPAW